MAPRVRDIVCWRMFIQEHELFELLESFPHVQKLHLTTETFLLSTRRFLPGRKSLNHALLKIAPSLLSLRLESLDRCFFQASLDSEENEVLGLGVVDDPPVSRLVCLPLMNQMKHLRIDYINLFGEAPDTFNLSIDEIFPKSLVHLEIVDRWNTRQFDNVFNQDQGLGRMQAFLDGMWRDLAAGRLPCLQRVDYWAFKPVSEISKSPLPLMRELFRTSTVQFYDWLWWEVEGRDKNILDRRITIYSLGEKLGALYDEFGAITGYIGDVIYNPELAQKFGLSTGP
jgi:hypothetical protein